MTTDFEQNKVQIARWLYIEKRGADDFYLEPVYCRVWATADALRGLAFVLNQLADGVDVPNLKPWKKP